MELSDRELKRALLAHNRWLESGLGSAGNLEGVSCYAPRLTGARLDQLVLTEAAFPVADLRFARIMDSHCQRMVIRGCQAYQSSLNRSDFSGANLHRGRFVEALARSTNFQGADLRKSTWARADLRGADLRRVKWCGGDLTGADLRGADLRGADLSHCELVEADLRGCDLSQTNLDEAITWGALLPSS